MHVPVLILAVLEMRAFDLTVYTMGTSVSFPTEIIYRSWSMSNRILKSGHRCIASRQLRTAGAVKFLAVGRTGLVGWLPAGVPCRAVPRRSQLTDWLDISRPWPAVIVLRGVRDSALTDSDPPHSLLDRQRRHRSPTLHRPGHSKKNFRARNFFKISGFFRDIKSSKHAEKVPLKSSKNTVVRPTWNQ